MVSSTKHKTQIALMILTIIIIIKSEMPRLQRSLYAKRFSAEAYPQSPQTSKMDRPQQPSRARSAHPAWRCGLCRVKGNSLGRLRSSDRVPLQPVPAGQSQLYLQPTMDFKRLVCDYKLSRRLSPGELCDYLVASILLKPVSKLKKLSKCFAEERSPLHLFPQYSKTLNN